MRLQRAILQLHTRTQDKAPKEQKQIKPNEIENVVCEKERQRKSAKFETQKTMMKCSPICIVSSRMIQSF